jgi:hypothetical protein
LITTGSSFAGINILPGAGLRLPQPVAIAPGRGYAQSSRNSKLFVQCGNTGDAFVAAKCRDAWSASAQEHGRDDHFRFDLKAGKGNKSSQA